MAICEKPWKVQNFDKYFVNNHSFLADSIPFILFTTTKARKTNNNNVYLWEVEKFDGGGTVDRNWIESNLIIFKRNLR